MIARPSGGEMNYFTQKAELHSILTDLGHLSEEFVSQESKEEILQIQGVLETKRFPIVFAGRFSTGKSLLLNRLFLNDDLLPSKVTPTTARNVLIEYGDEKNFYLQKMGESEEITEVKVPANEDTIAEYCTHMGERKDEYERFVLKIPLDILRNGVSFIDTVGTEDIDDHYVSQTINSIEEAAVVVYVTNALQPLAQSETEFLQKYLEETPKKLFLVANKIDGRPSPQDQQDIFDDLSDRFSNFYDKAKIRGDEKVFLVSAKTEQGLDQLRERIIEFVGKDRVKELVFQCASSTKSVLDKEVRSIDAKLSQLQQKHRGEKDELTKYQQELESLENSLSKKEMKHEELSAELLDFAVHELEDALEKAQDRTLNRVANYEIAIEELAILVDREVRSAFKRSLKKIQFRFIESFEKRLGNVASIPVSDEAIEEMRRKTDLYGIASASTGIGGIGLTLFGIGQGMAAGQFFLTGWIFQTTLWGAAASASAPFLVPGILATVSAVYIYKRMESNKKQQTRVVVQKLFEEAKSNIDRITEAIEDSVERTIEELSRKVSNEKKALESIINETRPEIIEKEINEQRLKKLKLDEYVNKLSSYVDNAGAQA